MNARHGQLAYTSFDSGVDSGFGAGRSAGGWQVKETTGDLDPEDVALLVSGVTTALHPVSPVPDYPTAEQISRLPHRMSYRSLDDGRVAYWHTVPAGVDGTGRPGNVFAHVVVDGEPAAARPRRPIQRWRDPAWLCPYGPDQVRAATLPAQPPGYGTTVTKDSVIAFALDTSTWRLGTLFGLLDAVAAALDGGAPVVLGTQSVDSAAQWIGLVSFLMSPGSAQRLAFSTFDRVDQLASGPPLGQHLTAVPIEDLVLLPPGPLVIDETATLSLGELGREPHRTSSGQSIDVTAWSAMAQVALLDTESARVVMDDVERFAAQAGDDGLHAAWPMAMSVRAHAEFADARDEADAVLVAHSPAGLGDTELGRAVHGALDAMVGTTTADALHAVRQAPAGPAAEYADATYLVRALGDDRWLDQTGPIPLGPRRFGSHLPPGSAAAIGAALERGRTAGAARLLRVVEFLAHLGVSDPRIVGVFDADLASQLVDPWTGPSVAQRLPDASVSLRVAAASVTLPGAARSDGTVNLGAPVMEWLARDVSVPHAAELAEARPWDQAWTRAALRGALAQRSGAVDAADRFAQLWWLRRCGATTFASLAESAVWDPYELLVAAGDVESLGSAVLPTLLAAPSTPALLELASRVERAPMDGGARACARIRLVDVDAWLRDGNLAHQEALVPMWEGAVSFVGADRVDVDVAARLVSIAAVAAVSRLPFPPSCKALAARADVFAPAVDRVVAVVEAGLLSASDLVAAAVFRAIAQEEGAAPAIDDPVGDVVHVAGERVTGQGLDEDRQEATVARLGALSGGESDAAAQRKHRKAVHRFVSRHQETSQSAFGLRMWGGNR